MPPIPPPIRRLCRTWAGPAALIALVIWMLHRALFSNGRLVPALPNTDLFSEYLTWRYFGFTQWKAGHFPFWDPHIFCGDPFFAQIQSCLFYPFAWVNFICNAASSTTIEMAASLCAAGICTYAWARQRGISRPGAALAGCIFTFSGPLYLHVMSGYMTVMGTAAWMPLIFLAIDRLLAPSTSLRNKRFISAILIGAAGICLQFFGGHAQLAYYTLLIATLYFLAQIPRRPRVYLAFIAMYVLGTMLAAVQLLPGYFATQRSIRAGGTSYEFASMVSLPPENLLSIFIPYPLGDIHRMTYLGRWYLWETTLYVGIIPLLLACTAISRLPRPYRWRIIALLVLVVVLALGSYTPLYWPLYKYLPGFGLFRGASKFSILWALLLAIFAGHGWDAVRDASISRRAVFISALAAAACLILAASVDPLHWPHALLQHIVNTHEYYVDKTVFLHLQTQHRLAHFLVMQWIIVAALLASMSLLIYLRKFSTYAAYALLVLAMAEVYFAAADSAALSPIKAPFPQVWTGPIASATAHHQRLLFADNGGGLDNLGNLLGYDGLWGYEATPPKRYTELIAATQNEHPHPLDVYYFNFHRISRVFELLRCRYILQWKKNNSVLALRDPMPILKLIGTYTLMKDSHAIAERLTKNFDFRNSAILESDPNPPPNPQGTAGVANILHQSINDMEIQAILPAPALLLITDAYAPGWHVRPLDPNPPQSRYQVLQADDVLRVIPLAAGFHHFDLYYIPPGLWPGIALSAIAALVFIGGIVFLLFYPPRADVN